MGETSRRSVFALRLPERFSRLAERFKRTRGSGGTRHGPFHGFRNPIERAGSPWRCFARILGMARERAFWIVLVFVLVVLGSGVEMLTPLLLKGAVDSLNLLVGNSKADLGRLIRMIFLMGCAYASIAVISFFRGWLSEKLAQDTLYGLRGRLFSHIEILPIGYFDRMTHGEILSRATNDVNSVSQMMSRGIVSFFASVLTLVCALCAMLWLSPLLTVATLVLLPLMIYVTKTMGRKLRACFSSQQTVLGLLNSHIEETITAQRVVKAFNHEVSAMDDFATLNREMRRVGTWARILGGSMGPVMAFLNSISFAVLVGVGAWLVLNGDITIGVVAAFIQYARQLSRPAMAIANQYNDIQSALAGAERVFAVMDESAEPDDGKTPPPSPVRGELDFKDVTFSYKVGEPVLKDFSLHVAPGRKVALVGTTGAGKTTVVSLLMRFYECDSGRISLDGVELRAMPRAALMRSMSMVLQDTWLFSGTVRDNIRYGRLESSDSEIEAAVSSIGADTFIRRLPNGYDTVLGENGGNLSQGQRQLISIARAILADAPVLILDEATSNVDTRTELLVQRAMIRLMRGRTCIVIAHRLSTIRDADVILVMEHGQIVEHGTRRELLASHGAYWCLEQSQYLGPEQNTIAEPTHSPSA